MEVQGIMALSSFLQERFRQVPTGMKLLRAPASHDCL